MNNFGQKVRFFRESKGLLLRQAAAYLEVDAAFLSNVELGRKRATREQARKIAIFLKVDEVDLIPFWISDKLLEVLNDEPFAQQAIDLTNRLLNGSKDEQN